MFGKKKILFGLISAFSLSVSGTALSQPSEMVLLKVHDIVPIKNDKGVTTSCEFFTTIVNKTNMNINELTIDMSWPDKAVENAIEREQNDRTLSRRENISTERFNTPNESISISIPELKINAQKTMKGKINSDRCFLLTQEPTIEVPSCSPDKIMGNNSAVSSSSSSRGSNSASRSNFSCKALLSYISPKDPQYYTNFMTVTIEEQEETDQKVLARQGEELDSMFRNTEVNLNKIIKILDSSIKVQPADAPSIDENTPVVEVRSPIAANNQPGAINDQPNPSAAQPSPVPYPTPNPETK